MKWCCGLVLLGNLGLVSFTIIVPPLDCDLHPADLRCNETSTETSAVQETTTEPSAKFELGMTTPNETRVNQISEYVTEVLQTTVSGEVLPTTVPQDILLTTVPQDILLTTVPQDILLTRVTQEVLPTTVPQDILLTKVTQEVLSTTVPHLTTTKTLSMERTITQNVARSWYVITIVFLTPWKDTYANKSSICSISGSLPAACQQVDQMIKQNLPQVNGNLGLLPTVKDQPETALLFYVYLSESEVKGYRGVLSEFVRPGLLGGVPVSQEVSISPPSDLKYSLRPTMGPKSGGTLLTVTGGFGYLKAVNIGLIECDITVSSLVVTLCLTRQLTDDSLVDTPMVVTIINVQDVNYQIARFNYSGDPSISLIKPLKTIVTGGVNLTVSGTNLDVPNRREMVTLRTLVRADVTETYHTDCKGSSPTEMFCPTPYFNNYTLVPSTPTEPTDAGGIPEKLFVVEISFVLDAVPDFTNLSAHTNLSQYSQVQVFASPQIPTWGKSRTRMFVPTWPVNDRRIEIQGKDMLTGLEQKDYKIMIGVAVCKNTRVFDNLITCEPPLTRPEVPPADWVGYNQIPVKVLYANMPALPGFLIYQQNLWEYPLGRHCIIAGICVIVFIALVFILCVYCCKHSRRADRDRTVLRHPTAKKQLNLVERVKRWSRVTPRRFSSFVPTGPREAPNYTGTLNDVNVLPYRNQAGLYREHYPSIYRDKGIDQW